jgi:glycosyltransferase involved in cell wall biosynthesis
MKICIVCPSVYPDSWGGDGLSIYLLSKYLKERGHEVILTTFDSQHPVVEERDNGRVYRYPGLVDTSAGWRPKKTGNVFFDSFKENEWFWITVALAVRVVNEREKPDIIHWYSFSPSPVTRLFTSCPQVATINTFWATCVKGTNILPNGNFCPSCNYENLEYCLRVGVPPYGPISAGLLSFLRAKMLLWERRYAANNMNELITLSYATKGLVELNRISSSRIVVIPNMYDPGFLQMLDSARKESKARTKEELRLDPASIVVSYVGRIAQEKGVGFLIECIPSISNEFRNVNFALAGKGPEEPRLRSRVKELGIEDYVTFMGLLDKNALAKLYAISDIVVAPQICFEAFGRVVLEAMLAQKPVITTNVGAPREFVQHMKTGIVIKAGDPNELAKWITRLLEDPALGNTLGINARKYAEEMFNPRKVGQEVEQLYQSLL